MFTEFEQLLELFSRIFLVVNVDSQKRDVGPDGRLWMGTFAGLQSYDPRTDRFTAHYVDPADPLTLAGQSCRALEIDAAGRLWAGTWGDGVWLIDPATGEVIDVASRSSDPVIVTATVRTAEDVGAEDVADVESALEARLGLDIRLEVVV